MKRYAQRDEISVPQRTVSAACQRKKTPSAEDVLCLCMSVGGRFGASGQLFDYSVAPDLLVGDTAQQQTRVRTL